MTTPSGLETRRRSIAPRWAQYQAMAASALSTKRYGFRASGFIWFSNVRREGVRRRAGSSMVDNVRGTCVEKGFLEMAET